MRRSGKGIPEILLLLLAVTLVGCGKNKAAPDMESLWESIAAETAVPELDVLGEKQQRDLLGLESAELPQALVMVSRDAMRLDEIWLLECADTETAKRMETLAENRRQALCRQSRDYLPEQYALAQKARICRKGVYLGFFLGEDADRMSEIFRRALG